MKHTAQILNPVLMYGGFLGAIYNDSRDKFPDGEFIRSSTIVDDSVRDGVRYIETRNSIYEVIEQAPQGEEV